MPDYRMIPYELLLDPPFPMREQFGDMPFEDLVSSIRATGLKQPILVRPAADKFEVMDGHRRKTACGVVGMSEVPCLVEVCDDQKAVETMVNANKGREDVSPTEEGRFYEQLIQRFNISEEEVSRMVRESESYVSDRLALVRCDEDIANAVRDKLITFSCAKELLRVNPYTAALVLRCAVDTLPDEQKQKIEAHRKFLLDLCIRCGAPQRVARSYVEQWKVSLVPLNPFPVQTQEQVEAAASPTRMPRCFVCGRDADQQNMLELKVHFWEKAGVLKILREAGMEVYE